MLRFVSFFGVLIGCLTSTAFGQQANGTTAPRALKLTNERYRLRAGERVVIEMPEEERGFVRSAKMRVVILRGRPVQGFTFGLSATGEIMLGASLNLLPGAYGLTAEVVAPSNEIRLATLSVTVDAIPHASNAAGPPVILLDGFQLPSVLSSCPMTTDSTGTFGNLQSYLQQRGLSVYFFENCSECPNCAIEVLGSQLGRFLDSLQVAQVDVIAHSMGGLVVRSYLSGKQPIPSSFVPRADVKIRKAIFVGTPHFGSYQADSLLADTFFGFGNQASEMKRGSQFLWDLATWNQYADDLHGVDAIAIAGNRGSYGNSSQASDGIVALTSASLAFVSTGLQGGVIGHASDFRTRIMNYCHIPASAGSPEASFMQCTGPGIAYIDSQNHPTYQIIDSFLAGTTGWQSPSISHSPSADQYLSRYLGLLIALRNSQDQYVTDLTSVTATANGNISFSSGPNNPVTGVYYQDFLAAASYKFSLVSSSRGTITASQVVNAGGYESLFVKTGPLIQSVQSATDTGRPGVTVASGSTVTISGLGFDATSVVSASGIRLTSSFVSPQRITATLPATFSGLVPLRVGTASGQTSTNIFVVAPSTSPVPSVIIASVTNAASGAPGPIAPGEIVTIKGIGLGPATGASFSVNPTSGLVDSTLAGTQVSFSGFTGPVTYASAGQVNAIVPYEVAGRSQVVMQVTYQGITSSGSTLPVAAAAPGVFTLSGSGTGSAIAANQDGSLNRPSSPATPGSYVTLYFTGGGQTNPPGVTGSITGTVLKWLTQNVTATVGGQPATVAFAGAAPTFVDGVGQMNIQLGSNTPSGSALPLVITVGGISSVATATLSVQSPPTTAILQSLTVSPAFVQAGTSVTGTLALSAAAPAGGLQVSLSSDNSSVQVPASITVASGQTTATFTISTTTVPSTQTATITARLGTGTITAALSVSPAGFSLQGKSFVINGTLTIASNKMSFEIQGINTGDSYEILIDDGASTPIEFVVGFSSKANNPGGMTLSFSGLADAGQYLDISNPLNPVSSAITAATLLINFTSLSSASSVTGSLALAISGGQINGTFAGTLVNIR